ncbi:glyoxylate reductase/hydroxypyruvate reductase-like isoform X3 [Vespa velutina]|uniref:glyoxylate reductase/hydroxypyruvate reductase-like isoform X3 n=1 Tax=Vespa velutina TaxID=202808 RepID=UPI001FB4F6A7|nr:glyoxylate reductase/hydroxypyruvate reductase-like isoform X3 [Vespa velutina]
MYFNYIILRNSTKKIKIIHPRFLYTSFMKMANKPKVLITRPDIPGKGLNLLHEQCDVILWNKQTPIPRSELLSKVSGVSAIFCTLTDKIDEEILNAAGEQLQVVATMSVGLLLATSRRLLEANKAIYRGEWKAWAPTWMCGTGLSKSTIGIVGLGRIGCKVAECLKPFDVSRILYTSRTVKQDASKFNGEKVELDKLLEESDFVIVTIALTPDTRELFNTQAFEKMKKSAIFINASRGEVINQKSLIEALKNGTIKAAGLDVMTPEPIPLDNELLKLDNCVVLPHIGSATIETREEMAKITAENILAVLKGDKMPAPLNL